MNYRPPLRPIDLRSGELYVSPTGRVCMLMAPQSNGLSRTAFLFNYLTRTGKASEHEALQWQSLTW